MNIIIVGCGKVGYAIASQLTDEGHEITLIDSDSEKLKRASSSLDTLGIVGNGTVYSVLLEAGIKTADVFIAVTDKDEVNLLACVIAKKARTCHTIARVKSHAYYDEISFLSEELGISFSFNPESMTANEISKLIHYPSAIEIDTFAKGMVTLIKTKIPDESTLNGMSLKELGSGIGSNVLVCAVERNKEIIIPDGNFVLATGDVISFTIPEKQAYKFFNSVGIKAKKIRNAIIAGGNTISYYLADLLRKSKISVKIIEPDLEKCKEISAERDDVVVINGDINDSDLLMEEGIKDADALIALSSSDEENIVFSLYASKITKSKVITKISRNDFFNAFEDLPGSLVCPRNITAEYIIGYVRSLKNSMGSNVESVYKILDGRVEAMEFKISEKSEIVHKPLSTLKLKKDLLICGIIRNKTYIKPSGRDMIVPGDTVIVATTNKGLDTIDDILE